MKLSTEEVAVLDQIHLAQAAQLGLESPKSNGSFSVGAVLADCKGQKISTGFTREFGEHWHAEHVALEKAYSKGINFVGG